MVLDQVQVRLWSKTKVLRPWS